MAHLKKNALNQIMFVLVDKTDFASIESGVTSNITVKFYGVNHGLSAAAGSAVSGTVSKLASVVHSGIFRQTLKAAECNYDYVVYNITHASCANQVLAFQTVNYDDSDIYSYLSDMASDIKSVVSGIKVLATSTASDVISMISTVSQIYVLAASTASDVISMISTVSQLRVRMNYSTVSDLSSKIASHVWAVNIAGASMTSLISPIT